MPLGAPPSSHDTLDDAGPIEAMGEADIMFLIPRHPVIRPNVGFIELSAGLAFWYSIMPLLEHVAMRAANRAMNE